MRTVSELEACWAGAGEARSTRMPARSAPRANVIDNWAEGMRRKDAPRVMAHGAQGFLHFSLAPPLIAKDVGAEGLKAWFDTWLGPIEFEIADLEITAGEDVAFCTSINRLRGTKTDGETNEIWFRQTLGLKKE